MNYTMLEMGNSIRVRRKELGMKQYELAARIEISKNYMSSIENGKRNISVHLVVKLCDALNVTPDYLFMGAMYSDNVPLDIYEQLKRLDGKRLRLAREMINVIIS